ncbi:MAG: Na+/H+ antiporter subunit E [Pseudomonadota bacterium]
MRVISLFIVLILFWLLLSGYFKTLLITLGILSCAFCVYICHRMKIIDAEGHPIHLLFKVPIFFPMLFWEIFKSAIDVTKVVLSPKLNISAKIFALKAEQKTSVGINVFANSITLTPGTFTMIIKGNDFVVHALTQEGADGLITGEMPLNKKVADFENVPSF